MSWRVPSSMRLLHTNFRCLRANSLRLNGTISLSKRLKIPDLMPPKQNGLFHQPISAFSTSFPVRSSSKNDDDDDHKKALEKLVEEEDAISENDESSGSTTTSVVDLPPAIEAPGVPVTQSVPESWPIVPIIAVNKHPVFPKFIKIVEVTNPTLMDILRRKVRLNQPYAGVFVKKDDENMAEVVTDPDEIYPIGSFVQIVEVQDLGPKLRMVVSAHRRISFLKNMDEYAKEMAKVQSADNNIQNGGGEFKNVHEMPKASSSSQEAGVYVAETENLNHEPYEVTDEMKALTQEIIKTIRDIIVS